MIPKETINKIFEEARIEEVVGDFVSLKKKGANLLGVCPFHNEKTPSFTVSPAKGIYKCFGCGAAGNSVNFLMQLEQLSYPEALKQLAKKYNIEIIENELTDDQKKAMDERERMFLLTQFASNYFINNLLHSDEGKLIGHSYFKERGISDEMMERFGLGFSFEQRDAFTKQAIEKGYPEQLIQKTGLGIHKEGMKPIDRFYGRVMFPIHNLSGRVLGFGARTLRTDKKIAKYLNSPETDIYHKSKVLYGLYQSKRKIVQDDNCFLVEGYTDVISLHQKGIENVVASSGTSLTEDQIKLIRRFTPNITVLFDGDAAGIKASFRGIDMLLKEDMNVKVVSFPDGEDPDSFARKNSTFDLEHFLKDNAQDFISFKCSILMQEAGDDPFKKAALIKDVVSSVALISDNIVRSVYIKEAAKLLNIEEPTLVAELTKIRNKKAKTPFNNYSSAPSNNDVPDFPSPLVSNNIVEPPAAPEKEQGVKSTGKIEVLEGDLIRLLLLYGHLNLVFQKEQEEGAVQIDSDANEENDEKATIHEESEVDLDEEISVAEYVIKDLLVDEISFTNSVYQEIFQVFQDKVLEGEIPTEKYFTNFGSPEVVQTVIDFTNEKYTLSENWKKHLIFVVGELDQLKLAIAVACNRLKMGKIQMEIDEVQLRIKKADPEDSEQLDEDITRLSQLLAIKKVIATFLGRT